MNKTGRVFIAFLILAISCKCSFTGRLLKKEPTKKLVWEIVSVKDPKLNKVLKTEIQESWRKITVEGGHLYFDLVNGCSASTEPGYNHNDLVCQCQASANSSWNELAGYTQNIIGMNLEGFFKRKFLSKTTTLKGKGGKEMVVTLVTSPGPRPQVQG